MNARFPDLPDLEPGWVWLVGAGPGDPGLLTLAAHHALGQAEAVVYDALVGEGVLALARAGAELHFAGKRGGKPSPASDLFGKSFLRVSGTFGDHPPTS